MIELYEQHHLRIERDGDDFILRQIDHSGNDDAVALHLSQIRTLAEQAGVLKPQPLDLAEHLTAGHTRRLCALCARIAELYESEAFFNAFWDRCGDAAEWWLHIRSIAEQAEELRADLGIATAPDAPSDDVPPSQGQLELA